MPVDKVCFGAYNHASGSQWSWRVPTLAQALCPMVQILTVWFMPESPRWLVSKGMVRGIDVIGSRDSAEPIHSNRNPKPQLYLRNITPMVATDAILSYCSKWLKLGMLSEWRKRSTRASHIGPSSPSRGTESECAL